MTSSQLEGLEGEHHLCENILNANAILQLSSYLWKCTTQRLEYELPRLCSIALEVKN